VAGLCKRECWHVSINCRHWMVSMGRVVHFPDSGLLYLNDAMDSDTVWRLYYNLQSKRDQMALSILMQHRAGTRFTDGMEREEVGCREQRDATCLVRQPNSAQVWFSAK